MGAGCLTVYIVFAMLVLLPMIFAQVVTGAFVILGFTPQQAFAILILVLIGGLINIPVKRWPHTPVEESFTKFFNLEKMIRRMGRPREKILAVNIGGAVIPGLISIWQIIRLVLRFGDSHPYGMPVFIIVFSVNVYVSYKLARPVEGVGITMPAFIPPLIVSVLSLILAPSIAPVIAFPAGTLGGLVGADLMHLNDIRKMNTPGGSIGGAGTFDGIFLTGILSVFLTG